MSDLPTPSVKAAPSIAFTPGQQERLLQGVIVADLQGNIISVNKYGYQLFGYKMREGELLGKNVTVLMPPAYREHHTAQLRRFNEFKVFSSAATRMVSGLRKNGDIFGLRLCLSYVEEPSPRVVALCEDVKDVSIVVKTNCEGDILQVIGTEDDVLDITAMSLIEIMAPGRNVSELCPPNIARIHKNMMAGFAERKRSPGFISKVVGETRHIILRNANGVMVPVLMKVVEEGNGFAATITLVKENAEGSFSISPSGKLLSIDDTCQVVFGYEAQELIGQFVGIICPKFRAKTGQHIGKGIV
jgi:PAS domain S-box-containing protein